MKKKPLSKRIKAWFVRKVVNPIKYRNANWCFDGSKCSYKKPNCKNCYYYEINN